MMALDFTAGKERSILVDPFGSYVYGCQSIRVMTLNSKNVHFWTVETAMPLLLECVDVRLSDDLAPIPSRCSRFPMFRARNA